MQRIHIAIATILLITSMFIGEVSAQNTDSLTYRQQQQLARKTHRDSIRAHKAVWLSILGGPSYTPEASLGIGGAVLASFKTNKHDSISQRSFIPAGFNISINGTFIVAGAGVLFFNENRFKIYANYGYRNEPTQFYGVGFKEIDHNSDSLRKAGRNDSVTSFRRSYFNFNPRFIWALDHNMFIGFSAAINSNKVVKSDSILASHIDKGDAGFNRKYHNIGLGGIFQYDTRNDIATPTAGVFANISANLFGKYLGGSYNYEIIELEYRQFENVFHRRSTLAWMAKSQIGMGDIPFTELPTWGSPNDLRGYLMGKYRDKSMAYGIVEYRHMFGSQEAYNRGSFLSKCGFVVWTGTGTLGKDPSEWDTWKLNYGAGIRIQIQPGKNFRLDFGGGPHQKPGFYMNMTEAF